MIRKNRLCIWMIAPLVILMVSAPAWAWGPATHISLAEELLAKLWLLPPALGALLARHRKYFLFGNVATDTVLAKKLSKVKQICHRWATGFSLLDDSRTEAGQAFAYGYLAHLAADTVAHNKFLPRQMAVSRSTITFGHVYWEIRADAMIGKEHWRELRGVLRGKYSEPDRLLRAHLTQTMLSYGTNRFIFKRMNLLASFAAWRRSVALWSKLSRFGLDERMLRDYHQEAIARITDVLSYGRQSVVLHDDPNGNTALSHARAQRRHFRQLQRSGISFSHAVFDAAEAHAPSKSIGMPQRKSASM